MTRDEALALLCGGADGIREWNRQQEIEEGKVDSRWAKPSGAELSGAELFGANLSEAQLRRANLFGANLSEADLSGADLFGADLFGAKLTGADLTKADLTKADLTKADLTKADLTKADLTNLNLSNLDLTGANLTDLNLSNLDLSGANLSGAYLTKTDLTGAKLTGADITNANLVLTRLLRVDLTGCRVGNALVQDTQIQDLRGLPHPPKALRIGKSEPYTTVTGIEAANFFVLPAVVEVFLAHELLDAELAYLHFHQGEFHANRVAADVYLVGHRYEAGGSVLRFQGPTYDTVYAALPDLLAAFRTTEAIDWKKTLGAIPKDERGEAITVLVKAHKGHRQRWELAQRLALVFDVFNTAQIKWIGEERTRGVRIEVFEDEDAKKELAVARTAANQKPSVLVLGQGHQVTVIEGSHMGNKNYNAINSPGAAVGDGASVTAAQIITSIRQTAEQSPDADLVATVKKALEAITKAKLPEPDQIEAAETVSKVQKEAEKPKAEADAGRPGRLKRWLDSLAAICKPAADTITAAKAVATALGG